MSNPAGLSAVCRPNVLQPKTIPKSLVFIFVLAQFFFGIDYGFFATLTSKRLRALAYFGSVLSVLFIVTGLAHNFIYNPNSTPLDPLHAVKVVCVFFILHFSKYKLRNFLTDIMAIDDTCNVDLSSHIGLKTSLTVVYICCYRFVMSGLFCAKLNCLEGGTINIIWYVVYEASHVFHAILVVVNCLVFYAVYLRVKFLKSAFEQGEFPKKKLMIFFKSLADCLKKIRVSKDTLIVLRFVTDCLTCITFIWDHLKWIKLFPEQVNYIYISIDSVHLILYIWVPAVVAEMVAVQIDRTKLLIHERLLVETNRDKSQEMLELLRYIAARPLTHKAWRLVPVDLRMPVAVISMSATYLIVLVQLTHLY